MTNTIFQNLKVIELASVLAGPAVGMFFAELGAKVIKIENATTGGDVTRSWRLASETDDTAFSAYYSAVNYGKESLLLDLNDVAHQQQVQELLKEADIVISNFRPSAAQKWGLDVENVRERHQRIIFAQLNSYPDDEDETPAFDVVLQAETGFMYMNGERGGNAVKMPVALIDILAAHQLKEAILIALLKRIETGKGATVTTSLYESAIASLANQATNWLIAGHIPQRIGSQHPNIAPYGDMFLTKDRKEIVLACGTERQFRNLCIAFQKEAWTTDIRFQDNQQRLKNRNILVDYLQEVITEYDLLYLQKLLKKYKVPCGAIRDMEAVFEDEKAQKMILVTTKTVKTVAFGIDFGK